ncbi:MAG: DUF1573 domain-containing protein [Paludibacteraceae bacterium]|nr:DUF1573 domain-containing protein [Paludibacteraceae bacterium]
MKKMLMLAAILCSVVTMAQEPVITFNETTHDFGKINEADGKVTTIFEFTNEGMTPLVLTNVRASCGCTTPKWTHEPIEPGQKGQITVTYNPSGRPGRFQKTVTVTSNATVATAKLYIKGEVIPKPAKPTEEYPVQMGELRLKKKTLNFSDVTKGSKKTYAISYANTTDAPITVDIACSDNDYYFKPLVTRKELQPAETGIIQVTLDAEECPIYGPLNTEMHVVVNGQTILSEEYAINIKANIKEDFSKMSVADRQQAPIMEYTSTANLGTIKAGKKVAAKYTLSNIGVNSLIIRRAFINDSAITLTAPKTIKGGKKADIKVELNTADMTPGNYSRVITIITNDPAHAVVRLHMNWTIE